MNVLITAGGTSEKIDAVRAISNGATGRLGSLIAAAFLREGAAVTYVCSEGAVTPKDAGAEILRIGNVENLKRTLEKLLEERAFDAVIHSMAVSDYSVRYSASSEALAGFLTESLLQNKPDFENREQLLKSLRSSLASYEAAESPSKISSDIERLFLCLERTPKVIRLFKALQPDAVLVGFKLLAGAEERELLAAAKRLMETNRCDFVLANDKSGIDEKRHAAILIGKDGPLRRLATKQEIAAAIVAAVLQQIKERNEP